MMSLGSMITQARKNAGLSIDDLSAATSIRSSLLNQMEANDFTKCGGETYARGHIRNVAKKLDVDPIIFLTAFEEEQMHTIRSIKDLLVENSVMQQPGASREVSWRGLAKISVASFFVAGLIQIIVSSTQLVETSTPITSATVNATTSPDLVKPIPMERAKVSKGMGVQLTVSATRAKSWLFVSDATGRTLFSGQISQDSTRTFSTDVLLNVKIGNAGGVDLTVNGKNIGSIGADGEVVNASYGLGS